jgi:hypothetical protein
MTKLRTALFWVITQRAVVEGKVKVTLVQALRLCTGRMAHMGVEI